MSTRTPQAHNRSVAGRLVFSLLMLALALGIFIYRQELVDQYNVWSFRPVAQVAALAERADLSDQGKFYFYASRPILQDRTSFNQSCTTVRNETTAVLGCYAAQRIYLFDVADEQLDGIKEVTAAHEMLHAAYDRLAPKEKERINDLLAMESEKITDPALTELLKEYEKSEPGERLNELHSLIGTQVGQISPELESYYSRYFKDRKKVVTLYQKYESVFTALKARQEALAQELEALSEQIGREVTQYNHDTQALNADIEQFNARARAGSFSSESEFNAERNRLIARQRQLVTIREGLNITISTFNTKRDQLAAINSEAEALNRSINSNLDPLPTIDG